MEVFYYLLCTRFRCLKHWLVGESKGQSEIFIDNLPGGPDNVNLAEDGSFWIALIEVVYCMYFTIAHVSLLSNPDNVVVLVHADKIKEFGHCPQVEAGQKGGEYFSKAFADAWQITATKSSSGKCWCRWEDTESFG